jgi:nitrite reductase/ring-hydroxylating ferredoxin subunit
VKRIMGRSAERYVDRLLRGERPGSFAPTDDEAAMVTAAIELKAADPDAAVPRPEFVDALHERLAEARVAADAESRAPAAPSAGVRHPRRRWMLAAGALTATGVAVGTVVGRLTGSTAPSAPNTPNAASQNTVISPTAGTWQSVAASVDLPTAAVLPFDLGAVSGFLYRTDGRVRAVSGTCTHQACRLSFDKPSDLLVCPCHGATFTLSGVNLAHPRRTSSPLPGLPRLPVREQGGQIQVYAPPPEQVTADPAARSAASQ